MARAFRLPNALMRRHAIFSRPFDIFRHQPSRQRKALMRRLFAECHAASGAAPNRVTRAAHALSDIMIRFRQIAPLLFMLRHASVREPRQEG